MSDRGTDGIDVGVRNQEVGIRTVVTERVVAGEVQFLAGLPPTVDGCDNVQVERVVQLRFEFNSSCFRFEKSPITFGNSIRFCRCRMNFDERFWNRAAQARDVAVLFIAKMDVSEIG